MTPIALSRRVRPVVAVPITSLIDVLLILLIFFMITSTYLNLNMIPVVETGQTPPEARGEGSDSSSIPQTLLVRLDASGRAVVFGGPVEPSALSDQISRRLAADPETSVIVLPSPRASLQALVDLLDQIRSGGAAHVQVVRLDDVGAQ